MTQSKKQSTVCPNRKTLERKGMTKKNKGQRSGETARVENQIAKNERHSLCKNQGEQFIPFVMHP